MDPLDIDTSDGPDSPNRVEITVVTHAVVQARLKLLAELALPAQGLGGSVYASIISYTLDTDQDGSDAEVGLEWDPASEDWLPLREQMCGNATVQGVAQRWWAWLVTEGQLQAFVCPPSHPDYHKLTPTQLAATKRFEGLSGTPDSEAAAAAEGEGDAAGAGPARRPRPLAPTSPLVRATSGQPAGADDAAAPAAAASPVTGAGPLGPADTTPVSPASPDAPASHRSSPAAAGKESPPAAIGASQPPSPPPAPSASLRAPPSASPTPSSTLPAATSPPDAAAAAGAAQASAPDAEPAKPVTALQAAANEAAAQAEAVAASARRRAAVALAEASALMKPATIKDSPLELMLDKTAYGALVVLMRKLLLPALGLAGVDEGLHYSTHADWLHDANGGHFMNLDTFSAALVGLLEMLCPRPTARQYVQTGEQLLAQAQASKLPWQQVIGRLTVAATASDVRGAGAAAINDGDPADMALWGASRFEGQTTAGVQLQQAKLANWAARHYAKNATAAAAAAAKKAEGVAAAEAAAAEAEAAAAVELAALTKGRGSRSMHTGRSAIGTRQGSVTAAGRPVVPALSFQPRVNTFVHQQLPIQAASGSGGATYRPLPAGMMLHLAEDAPPPAPSVNGQLPVNSVHNLKGMRYTTAKLGPNITMRVLLPLPAQATGFQCSGAGVTGISVGGVGLSHFHGSGGTTSLPLPSPRDSLGEVHGGGHLGLQMPTPRGASNGSYAAHGGGGHGRGDGPAAGGFSGHTVGGGLRHASPLRTSHASGGHPHGGGGGGGGSGGGGGGGGGNVSSSGGGGVEQQHSGTWDEASGDGRAVVSRGGNPIRIAGPAPSTPQGQLSRHGLALSPTNGAPPGLGDAADYQSAASLNGGGSSSGLSLPSVSKGWVEDESGPANFSMQSALRHVKSLGQPGSEGGGGGGGLPGAQGAPRGRLVHGGRGTVSHGISPRGPASFPVGMDPNGAGVGPGSAGGMGGVGGMMGGTPPSGMTGAPMLRGTLRSSPRDMASQLAQASMRSPRALAEMELHSRASGQVA